MRRVTVDEITQGGVIRSTGWGDLRATESDHPADLRLDPHRHPVTCLTYVLRGGFVESVDDRDFHCRPGTVLLKRSNTVHANRYGPSGARSLLVAVPTTLLDRFEAADALFESSPVTPLPEAAWAARRIHREVCSPDLVSALAVEGLLLEMLALAARRADEGAMDPGPPPGWLEDVREALHERYANPPSLRELAALADVHPDHLGRAFRRRYHATPGAYARRLRLENAVRLITETDRPLGEIAVAAGFSDQSHMTRQVRKATGATPGRLRNPA